jgi:hypothetical protein
MVARNPPLSAVFRTAKIDTTVDGQEIHANSRVLASLVDASNDYTVTTQPIFHLGGQGLMNPAFFNAVCSLPPFAILCLSANSTFSF